MMTSEQIGELAAALAKAQGEMKSALKTAVNSAFARGGSGGSKYATLADCADAAHPVLAKNGLCLIGAMDTDHFVARLAHSSGQWIEGRWPVPGDLTKMTIQQMMACQTYLRRASYSLVGLVSDEEDDGNVAAGAGAVRPDPLITPDQAANLEALMTEVGADAAAFLKYIKADSLASIRASQYADAVNALRRKGAHK